MKNLLLALLLSVSFSGDIMAQVSNQTDLYADLDTCGAYAQFLDVAAISEADKIGCDAKTLFLIENNEKGISEFLREYISKTQESSLLNSLAESLRLVVRSFTFPDEGANAFFALGSLEVQIYSALSGGGDNERAVLYGSLLFDTKMRMLKRELKENSLILEGIQATKISISDLLGEQFTNLDPHSSDLVLLCLLRTDNFRVSIGRVLTSNRLNTCIERNP